MTDRVVSLFDPTNSKKTLYRILPFERLAAVYRDKKIALISPEKWEDPFETYWLRKIFPESETRIEEKRRVFGMCLSFESRSDALWRIYSPTNMGVRIKIDAEELLRQLQDAPELTQANVYLGPVDYLGDPELVAKATELQSNVARFHPAGIRSEAVARAWMYKRRAFVHEHEARVIAVFPNRPNTDELLRVSVDPMKLISSINLDPRCGEDTVQAMRSHFIGKFGVSGIKIRQSALYKLPAKLSKGL